MKPAILFDKLYIPVESISAHLEAEISDKLTLDNPAYHQALKFSPSGYVGKSVPKHLTYYDDSNPDYIGVPRGFNFEEFSREEQEEIKSIEVSDQRLSCRYKMPGVDEKHLFDDQQEVVLDVAERLMHPDSRGACMVVLPVSSGKTRMCLAVASLLNERTLILCDNSLIAEGWVAEINKIFGWSGKPFKPKKSRFKNKQKPNVGIIKGPKVEYGRYFTICSWQTVNRRGQDFWDHISSHHGLMVVDEAEVCAANIFHKFINHYCGKYKLAITGTDYRSDGLEKVLFFEFGNPFIKRVSRNVETKVSLPVEDVKSIRTKFNYSYEHGYDYMIYDKECSKDAGRLKVIAEAVLDEYHKGGHCLVVTNTRDHAKAILVALGDVGEDVTMILGNEQSKEKAQGVLSGKYRIVISTVSYVFKGVNSPRLDRLFIASLIGNERILTQLIGRVRRKAPGKKNVLVYDFIDRSNCVRHIYRNRQQVYANIGVKSYKNTIFL